MDPERAKAGIPAQLVEAPSDRPGPPAVALAQELPFWQMSWENFEKLWVALALAEGECEEVKQYGRPGGKQHGIDILARVTLTGGESEYRVYQCKHYGEISRADILSAVNEFRHGHWLERAKSFLLCTTADCRAVSVIEEAEKQRVSLAAEGLAFTLVGRAEVNRRLKTRAEIVDEFFGREWVRAFCGDDAARALHHRIAQIDRPLLTRELRDLYVRVFAQHDPWIAVAATKSPQPALLERYVAPDVTEEIAGRASTVLAPTATGQTATRAPLDFGDSKYERSPDREAITEISHARRTSVLSWLSHASGASVLLAEPGAGKSTLLRAIALDALGVGPPSVVPEDWRGRLPVWISFHHWTSLIRHGGSADVSLLAAVTGWLAGFGKQHLGVLVRDAVESGTALLLVDGLDEAASATTGELALGRLLVSRGASPVLATSRPDHGFIASLLAAQARVGHLALMNHDQRARLSCNRLAYLSRARDDQTPSDEDLARTTREFVAAIDGSQLHELSSNPMFLLLLTDAWHREAALPASRSDVLQGIVVYLLGAHSRRRLSASGAIADSDALEVDEVRKALEHLAWVMTEEGSFSMERSRARRALGDHVAYLRGIEQASAQQLADGVLGRGARATPLLVERSDADIGFVHRAFQDHLAAGFALEKPREAFLDLFRSKLEKRNWGPVLACVAEQASESDLRAIVEILLTAQERTPARALLADLACSAVWFPPDHLATALGICDKAIRSEPDAQTALSLARAVVRGMARPRARELVRGVVSRWLPSRSRWRSDAISLVGQLEPDAQLLETLYALLNDEEEQNVIAAAGALVSVAKRGQDVLPMLRDVLLHPRGPDAQAAALHAVAMLDGRQEVSQWLKVATLSEADEVRLVAHNARVVRGEQDDSDIHELLRIGAKFPARAWRPLLTDALATGWPHSTVLRDACLAAIRQSRYGEGLDSDTAVEVAVRVFSRDPAFASLTVELLRGDERGYIAEETWQLAEAISKDAPSDDLRNAGEEHALRERAFAWPDLHRGARVARTGRVREALMERLRSMTGGTPWWDASTLVDVWGPDDVEISELIVQITGGDAGPASRIALEVPRVLEPKQATERLVAILGEPTCERPDFVMNALLDLSEKVDHSDVVAAYFAAARDSDALTTHGARTALIAIGPNDERVRAMALEEIDRPWGATAAVVKGYGSDSVIRSALLSALAPARDEIRYEAACQLAVIGRQGIELRRAWTGEVDADVRSAAAAAAASAGAGAIDEETLIQELYSTGFSTHVHRQAAIVALIEQRRLTVFRDAVDPSSPGEPLRVMFDSGGNRSLVLAERFATQWGDVAQVLGPMGWQRFGSAEGTEIAFWEPIAPFVEHGSAACERALVVAMERRNELGPNMLRLLGRELHENPDVRALFENLLSPPPRSGFSEEQLADAIADVITAFYVRDAGVRAKAEALLKSRDRRAVLVVSSAWPESTRLRETYDEAKAANARGDLDVVVALVCAGATATDVARLMSDLVKTRPNPLRRRCDVTTPMLTRRLREDRELRDLAVGWLDDSRPSMFVSAARLLHRAGHAGPEVLDRCASARANWSALPIAPAAYDLSTCRVVPASAAVADLLLDR